MAEDIKNLAVLGCTGSIGRQTLDIVRAFPKKFRVIGLAAGSNIALLKEQVAEFKPRFVFYIPGGKERPAFESCIFTPMDEMAAHPGY